MASVFASDASAKSQHWSKGGVAYWSIFKDGNYCWIATGLVPDAGAFQRILLMVDNKGEVFVLLNPRRVNRNDKWQNVTLSADSKSFDLTDNAGWGVVSQKNQSRVRKTLLSSSSVNFDATRIIKKGPHNVSGHFKTEQGSDAYKKMVETCG